MNQPPMRKEQVANAAEALRLISLLSCELVNQHAHDSVPLEASPAASEASSCLSADDLITAYRQGVQALRKAADHGLALCAVLSASDTLVYSPFTVARGVLESYSKCVWILDESITPDCRTARSRTLRISDINGAIKYYSLLQRQAPQRDSTLQRNIADARARVKEIRKEARKLGLKGVGATVSRVPFDDPTFANQLDYSLLSGVAHDEFWAVQALILQLEPEQPTVARLEIPEQRRWWLYCMCTDWIARSLWSCHQLLG